MHKIRTATMIKVYLDWNCITHCKDSFVELSELLEQYRNIFICPYSEAQLRDVLRRSDANPEAYNHDLDLLTQISNGNILLLKGGKIRLYKVSPRDYLLNEESNLNRRNKLSFQYHDFRHEIRSLLNPKDIERISKEHYPHKVMPLVENLIARDVQVADKINDFFERIDLLGKDDIEITIKQLYFKLDLIGYRSEEKKKSFANIDTDAQHIALAGLYEYLISDDKRMRDKANAIYSYMHCVTKVMTPRAFIKEMSHIVKMCYDPGLIPKAMNTYGFPTLKEDGAHVKALEYPLWGIFKYCYNAAALDNTLPNNIAFFMPEKQFMFYDELEPIAKIVTLALPKAQRESYINSYKQAYMQNKPLDNVSFTIYEKKYRFNCVLMTFEGLPALRVSYESIQ